MTQPMRQHPATGPGTSPHSAYLYGRCVVAADRLFGRDTGLGLGLGLGSGLLSVLGQASAAAVWPWECGRSAPIAGQLAAEFRMLDFRDT